MTTIKLIVIGQDPDKQIEQFKVGNESGRTRFVSAVLEQSQLKQDISDLGAVQGDAVVCNNGWYQFNGPNWWAMAPEQQTEEAWDARVKTLLEDFEPETLISMYICEIDF